MRRNVIESEVKFNYKKREEILAKECLDIKDFQLLFGVAYSTACEIIRKIKMQLGKDRLNIQGKLHILDYIEWLDIQNGQYLDRYTRLKDEKTRPNVFELYGKPEPKKLDLSYFGYENREVK